MESRDDARLIPIGRVVDDRLRLIGIDAKFEGELIVVVVWIGFGGVGSEAKFQITTLPSDPPAAMKSSQVASLITLETMGMELNWTIFCFSKLNTTKLGPRVQKRYCEDDVTRLLFGMEMSNFSVDERESIEDLIMLPSASNTKIFALLMLCPLTLKSTI